MARELAYRCLSCLEETVVRDFDVSHLSRTCSTCGSFERFVNEAVYEQFEDYEDDPPESLDWGRLDRREKLMVSERVTRTDRSIDDFDIDVRAEEPADQGEADAEAEAEAEAASEDDPADGAGAETDEDG